MKDIITSAQNKLLKALSGRIDDFYLGGGTALSSYYFHHRRSIDLDFFTHKLSRIRVQEVMKLVSEALKKQPSLIGQNSGKGKVKMFVYSVPLDKNAALKIDFIEEYLELIKPAKSINGIKVLSLEDIYMRKIYAVTGTFTGIDGVGRKTVRGGRQEAKDFYDLFCLSRIFMKLSDFSFQYGTTLIRELLIRWFRTYSRLDIKTGLIELGLKKAVDYSDMERHFKQEIGKILEQEVQEI
ncbi:MAG: nucleotidyl transferase AbiEii/AbiGii toxin family protein [Candidatus Omnitrophica bacterium]|nr:nucleotidyl transferase AbiEii/AbiGii toxin family protein [Candidatus Omnitrophota bacterium]